MRNMIFRYRASKFRRFTQGLIFAAIAVAALALCLAGISADAGQKEIILPFCIAVLSMLMGLIAMFHNSEKKVFH